MIAPCHGKHDNCFIRWHKDADGRLFQLLRCSVCKSALLEMEK